jgi:hypothetical protein
MDSQATETPAPDEQQVELPEEVADAWAAVLIDIHEKRCERNETEDVEADAAA